MWSSQALFFFLGGGGGLNATSYCILQPSVIYLYLSLCTVIVLLTNASTFWLYKNCKMAFDLKNSSFYLKGIRTYWTRCRMILNTELLRDKASHSISAKTTLSFILNAWIGEFEGIKEFLLPLLWTHVD